MYGAEAAARTYFQKHVGELTPQEAALLAAAIVNPRVMNPARPTAGLIRRQQLILRRMGGVEPPAPEPPVQEPPVEPAAMEEAAQLVH